jgi:predicted RNA binding protein YcfA (HicA-like mRNA interferase family)
MPRISPIPSRRLQRLFEKAGFKCVRTEGDHFVYTKKGVIRPIVIPDWPEVPVL